jgi:hypothetical protein
MHRVDLHTQNKKLESKGNCTNALNSNTYYFHQLKQIKEYVLNNSSFSPFTQSVILINDNKYIVTLMKLVSIIHTTPFQSKFSIAECNTIHHFQFIPHNLFIKLSSYNFVRKSISLFA